MHRLVPEIPYARRGGIHAVVAMALVAIAGTAEAGAIIHVPADQPTIQAAINAASDGDEVLVAPGTYVETINFLGKAIVVRAELEDSPSATVIDAGGSVYAVMFAAGEDENSKLVGFTVTGADLAGVAMLNSSPRIRKCILAQNSGVSSGTGATIDGGSPVFIDCRFVDNGGSSGIGAAAIGLGTPQFFNCRFEDHEFAGLYLITDAIVSGCVMIDNATGILALSVGGAPTVVAVGNSTIGENQFGILANASVDPVTVIVANSIVRSNAVDALAPVGVDATILVAYSNIEGGWPGLGNIDEVPGFVDSANGDLRLAPGSPCIDAGSNLLVSADLVRDVAGAPRFLDDFAAPDVGQGANAIVDMGAFERVQPIRLVDADAAGEGHGLTWTDAYTDLQDALDDAASGDVEEIWVAAGTYRPDRGTGDRTMSFKLLNGVALRGGFAGGETDAELADPPANETILGGGIGAPGQADNSYSVVRAIGVDATARLQGFVVQAGFADGPGTAGGNGAGLFVSGGAPTVRDCWFRGNETTGFGGAVYADSTEATFGRCKFSENVAAAGGGAIHVDGGAPSVVNCFLHGNTANSGGAIDILTAVGFEVVNTTITANEALGTAGGGLRIVGSSGVLRNAILWKNVGTGGTFVDQLLATSLAAINLGYSTIEGWSGGGGIGNSGADPLFADLDGADGILGTNDDAPWLLAGSPCIDSADAAALPTGTMIDYAGEPRFVDDPGMANLGAGVPAFLDRGCAEFQGTSVVPCPADLDGDGDVGAADLAILLGQWGVAGTADLDGNGVVEAADLALLLGAWGPC